jgi:cytochrome c-type biogenesis protein CcmH
LLGLVLLAHIGLVPAREAALRAEDPVVEARLVAIADELRCLVCQNESLASSHAELAEDLRREVRGLIREGKSDAEVKRFLVDRYGDFVLYRPGRCGSVPLRCSCWPWWCWVVTCASAALRSRG